MRKLKLFMATFALVGGSVAAMAQTDVTSTYLKNADFSQGTPAKVGICTYGRDMAGNGTENYSLLPVDDWTANPKGSTENGYENNQVAGGLVAFGSGVWIGGKDYVAPATNADGDAIGNILGLVAVWTGTAQYTQDVTLPEGTYTLVLGVYNSKGGTVAFTKNLIGFIEEGGAEHLATSTTYAVNTWKYEFITFTLDAETSGKISLGYQSSNQGSANMPHLFLSGLQLFSGEVDAEAYSAAKDAVRTKKELVIELDNAGTIADGLNELLGNLLKAEINKAKTTAETDNLSAEDYQAALDNLKAAEKNISDLNISYTNAIKYVGDASSLEYASEEKKEALDAAKNALDSAEDIDGLKNVISDIYTALRAYYESNAMAEGKDGAVNVTDLIKNPLAENGNNDWTWDGKKNDPASKEPWTDASGNSTHKYFDGGDWGANSWTTKMSQTLSLPAGKYLLTAKGRAALNTTLTLAVGKNSKLLPNVGSTGNVFDRGWGDASVEFTTDGSDATITVTASSETAHEWFSVSDFRLIRLELNETYADADDYAALNAAIEEAEKKTLGFEDGEYAPYNNVDALKALAAAKALNQELENGQENVQALTTALTEATWTANSGEVDAIYDGQFANTEANATSGNITLPGWTKVQGIRLLVKDEATDPGLAYTDGKAAVFSWGGTTLTYGEQAGYTLPLAPDGLYELTLKVSGWRDGDQPNYVSVELDGQKQEAAPVTLPINTSEGNPFETLTFYLKPTEENSILKIYGNHHFTIADLSMVKATPISVTVGSDGYATYVPKAPMDFSATDIKAYTAKVADGKVVLTQIEKVAAGTPVVLYCEGGQTEEIIPFAATTDKPAESDLVAGNGATVTTTDGTYTNYILNNSKGIGFYKANDQTVDKGRAYLHVAGSSEARLAVVFGDATGISSVKAVADGEAVYNLSGQRVKNASKGLFIIGGKKVVVK